MLSDILQAIKMLKHVENPPKEVNDTLDFLEQSVKRRTKESMLDLMSVGDVIGYDSLQEDLIKLITFLGKMKEQEKNNH